MAINTLCMCSNLHKCVILENNCVFDALEFKLYIIIIMIISLVPSFHAMFFCMFFSQVQLAIQSIKLMCSM